MKQATTTQTLLQNVQKQSIGMACLVPSKPLFSHMSLTITMKHCVKHSLEKPLQITIMQKHSMRTIVPIESRFINTSKNFASPILISTTQNSAHIWLILSKQIQHTRLWFDDNVTPSPLVFFASSSDCWPSAPPQTSSTTSNNQPLWLLCALQNQMLPPTFGHYHCLMVG